MATEMLGKQLKIIIREAFSAFEYPGDCCLRGSDEGNEPFMVEKAFENKQDRFSLDAKFLDEAPDGLGSALSFFSDEAFHFYLPAYLIADIDGLLERAEPLYYLTRGFGSTSENDRVNPRRYGERTWFDVALYKNSMFNDAEVVAIIAYLEFKSKTVAEPYRKDIQQALQAYWYKRGGKVPAK
jgi:hypothetical protein